MSCCRSKIIHIINFYQRCWQRHISTEGSRIILIVPKPIGDIPVTKIALHCFSVSQKKVYITCSYVRHDWRKRVASRDNAYVKWRIQSQNQWRKQLTSLAHACLNILPQSNVLDVSSRSRFKYVTIAILMRVDTTKLCFFQQWASGVNELTNNTVSASDTSRPESNIVFLRVQLYYLIVYLRYLCTITMHNQYIIHT